MKSKKLIKEENICLNERQKDILEQSGLPTNYSELRHEQKLAIESIEQILCEIEGKYGVELQYAGYIPASELEKEQVFAYPKGGEKVYDSFVITRISENGKYKYKDGYVNLMAKSLLSSYVMEFAQDILGEKNVKVYSIVESCPDDKVPQEIECMLGNIIGDSWVFIDSGNVKLDEYKCFLNKYTEWVSEKKIYGMTQMVYLNAEKIRYLTKYNYECYLSSKLYISRDHIYNKQLAQKGVMM